MKVLKKLRKQAIRVASVLWAASFIGGVCVEAFASGSGKMPTINTNASYVQKLDGSLNTKREQY